MYAEAIKNAVAKYQLTSPDKIMGNFDSKNEGKELVKEGQAPLKIDYNGNIVCKIIEIYEDGTIYLADCEEDGNPVDYAYGKKQGYSNGDIVYIDVTTGKSCMNYHVYNSKTGYNGINGTGNQNSCLKFYAFLDDGSDKINLILDHNTTANLGWTEQPINTNVNAPTNVINQLKIDTNEWNGTITPSNYEYKVSSTSYIIDYSEYKARLITAQEIAQITGADKENTLNFKEESSADRYYFHDYTQNEQTGSGVVCKYGWLYDRTSTNCTTYGCLNNSSSPTSGYWTSSALANNSVNAWAVTSSGILTNHFVGVTSISGVRPVITVLKSNIQK